MLVNVNPGRLSDRGNGVVGLRIMGCCKQYLYLLVHKRIGDFIRTPEQPGQNSKNAMVDLHVEE